MRTIRLTPAQAAPLGHCVQAALEDLHDDGSPHEGVATVADWDSCRPIAEALIDGATEITLTDPQRAAFAAAMEVYSEYDVVLMEYVISDEDHAAVLKLLGD